MKIQIKEVSEKSDGRIDVAFASDFGSAQAEWKGDRPKISGSYEVELDVEDVLVWGRTIYEGNHATPSIRMVDDQVLVEGILEREDDGCAFVRIGYSVIMVETKGTAPPDGRPICMKVKHPILYDTHT